jgi:SagB-type dehydrogenase family enzyme
MDETILWNRGLMQGYGVANWEDPGNDFHASDQQKGIAPPPLQKAFERQAATIIALPGVDDVAITQPNIQTLIRERRSRRRYADEALTLPQVGYLLWATQGVRRVHSQQMWTLRTVPSAGARHPYETYLLVNRVAGLEPGAYRYLPLSHELLFLFSRPSLRDELYTATYGEDFVADAPVCFVWSCIPYRGEWRYHTKAHKSMVLDAGHICQNLYLAAESIGCGTCAIGGYYQEGADRMLGLDGEDEFVVYLAPVGRLRRK